MDKPKVFKLEDVLPKVVYNSNSKLDHVICPKCKEEFVPNNKELKCPKCEEE